MGQIYESAAQTVVWLGKKGDPSFGEELKDCSHATSSFQFLRGKRMKLASSDDSAANRLATRPLRQAGSGAELKAVRREVFTAMREERMDLTGVLDYGVTKAEDRIYSLLIIAKDAEIFGLIAFKSSVRDIPDIICYSHLFHHDAANLGEKDILPSWVPDWRAHVEGKVVPDMASQAANGGTGNFRPTRSPTAKTAYKASGTTEAELSIDQHDKVLPCTSIIIDTTDGFGGSKYNDAGEAATHLRYLCSSQTRD
ncbi:hypothetical protein VTL71DRAFT_3409 [Oculimacula yallundae]|uniref:Uncharacterized protein n=1 Tax=Oculimacula yallundae TaxID=86028 RepID=A0ABR4C727_9HELO